MKLKSLKINNFRAINGENNVIQFMDNNIVALLRNSVREPKYLQLSDSYATH